VTVTVDTGTDEAVVDITGACADFVAGDGDGLLHVFVEHATAGLALIETGAGTETDLLAALRDLVPPYASIPVLGGRMALGTWQSVCLVDLNVDNRRRTVRLSFLPA
jgi:thiamine phosphate synthase YjbQ (UPF0047 family)